MISHTEKSTTINTDRYNNPVLKSKRPSRYPLIDDPFMSTLGLETLSAEIEKGLGNEKSSLYEHFPHYKKDKQLYQSLGVNLIKDGTKFPRFDSFNKSQNGEISYSMNANIGIKEDKYPFEERRMSKYQKEYNDKNIGLLNNFDSLERLDALIVHCFANKN